MLLAIKLYLITGLLTYTVLVVYKLGDIPVVLKKYGIKPIIIGFILTVLFWQIAIFNNFFKE